MKKISFLIASAVMLASCGGGFNSANKQFKEQFDNGHFSEAATLMSTATVTNDEPNHFYLGGLQCGTGYLWAAKADQSQMCFANVERVLSDEISEDSSYEIKNYEKIMFKTYQSINAISQNDKEARMFLNQAYDYQSHNISENGAEIEKMREKFAEDQQKLRESGVESTPSMDQIIAEAEAEKVDAANSVVPMKDFANPYTTWLMALYDGATGDLNNARNRIKRVAEFAPDNKFVKTDIDALSDGSVYVVFENGKVGPIKKRSLVPESLKALAQPLRSFGIKSGIKLTIPDVYPGTKALPSISVSTGDETVNTEFLASVDSIIKTYMDQQKSANIAKSVSFEVAKIAAATVAGIAANKAAKNSKFRDIITIAAVTAVMSAEMPWDLRSWDSMPNEIQVARVKMPSNHVVLVNDKLPVELPEDAKNAIIFVRVPTANAFPGIVVGKLN